MKTARFSQIFTELSQLAGDRSAKEIATLGGLW